MDLYMIVGGQVYVRKEGRTKAAVVAEACLRRGSEQTPVPPGPVGRTEGEEPPKIDQN